MKEDFSPAELELLAGFERSLSAAGLASGTILQAVGGARHFLRWLRVDGQDLVTIDDPALHRFRDHRCACPVPPTGYKSPPNTYKRGHSPPPKTVRGASRFVIFLEDQGHVSHPGELSLAQTALDRYEAWSCASGYPPSTRFARISVARHLLLWLHVSRVSIKNLTPKLIARFLDHDCLCPGCLHARALGSRSQFFTINLRNFVRFFVDDGWVADPDAFSLPKPSPFLPGFRAWLLRYRNVSDRTTRGHLYLLSLVLPLLPDDPTQYDAAALLNALLSLLPRYSPSTRSHLVASLRIYLRYLAAEGHCDAALIGALPSIPRAGHASVPRYVSPQDVERLVDSCDVTTPVGIRNRAILLMLARLGLRSGDVVHLDLSDLDWKSARLRVSGKSPQASWLPLPQDVGDALLVYLEKVRPRVDSTVVFLRIRAPHRPFRSSQAVGEIARSAVRRAGIDTPGGSGSHLLRHSLATGLIRSGASMELVSTVLRHRSLDTTSIYAKVDLPMLSRVAQPWPGEQL